MRIDTQRTVGEIVKDFPQLSRVFERHGIDFCCGGKRRLEETSRDRGIDPGVLAAELEADLARGIERGSWRGVPPAKLIEHIVVEHHQYLWEELPLLERLAEKVAGVHGGGHPELIDLASLFHPFRAELESHMHREEQVLFPMFRRLLGEGPDVLLHCGRIENPIRVMLQEHDQAGEVLARMRELTRDYSLPEGACNSYRGLYTRLEHLERDLHEHVHEENNILFPFFLEQSRENPE